NWHFPTPPPQNPNLYPEQQGIYYLWKGKNHMARGACGGEYTHGLDCSGFIYQIAKAAGIKILDGQAKDQIQPSTWNNGQIPRHYNLKARELKEEEHDELRTGDLVAWTGCAGHIGFVVVKQGVAFVYQSNGAQYT